MKPVELLAISIALIAILCGNLQAKISLEDFVVFLIKQRSETETGIPVAVFYGLSPKCPLHGVLSEVLQAPKLEHVTKLVITREFALSKKELLPFEVTVLVLYGDVTSFTDKCMNVLRMYSPYTRVIVLTRSPSKELRNYAEILEALKFYHVYFLDVIKNGQIWLDIFTKYFERRILGPRQYRNLRGKPITALMYKNQQFSTLVKNWFYETAMLMNTTFERYPNTCSGSIKSSCYQNIVNRGLVDVDSIVYHMELSNSRYIYVLITPMIENEVVLIPQSRMSIVQQFAYPLDLEVWIILGLLIVTLEIVHLILPNLIRNDPFLLIICGFEKRDLNKSKTLEIFILHSMMILMFFVFSAYETILLSWMTNSPSSRLLRTLADLVESGIKIKSDLVTHNHLINHSIVGSILVNSTESVRNMDYVHAHIVGRETAKRNIPFYYDPVQKLYRYTILDQPFSMFIQSYRFKYRSPLMEGFTQSLFIFFEGGIVQRWLAPLTWKTERYIGEDIEDDEDLHFSELMPVWAAILLGWVASIAVFLLEIGTSKIIRIGSKNSKKN